MVQTRSTAPVKQYAAEFPILTCTNERKTTVCSCRDGRSNQQRNEVHFQPLAGPALHCSQQNSAIRSRLHRIPKDSPPTDVEKEEFGS